MKILYVTLENMSLHKGSVVHIKEIVAGLRKLGHEVGLIAYSWNRFEKADRFYNLHKSFGFKKQSYLISSVLLLVYLIRIVSRYDVLYARDFHAVLIALIPRIIFNKRLVFEMNGIANEERRLKGNSVLNSSVSWLIRGAEYLATRHSDSIVSVTPQIASYIREQFNCPGQKIEVVSNGVNTEIFRPIDDEAILTDWRGKRNIPQGTAIITFVGNLAQWQGLDFLIRVAPRLLSRIKNLKFMVVGDGCLREDLEKEVKRLGLSDHFIFTGMVNHDEIPFYINISDVCVALKSRLRSGYSPLKLYEYMACGKPVVASRVEGLECVEAEGAGRLVDLGDIEGLERALSELLADAQKRAEMGRIGLRMVRGRFSWNSGVAKVENILKRLA